MSAMRTADEVIEDALYTEIRSLLEFCTEDQVEFLWRIYAHAPCRVFPLKVKDLRSILALVQRTVKLNQQEATQREAGR
jgi:hypothetical protein